MKNQKGFTLIELAIVLIIIGIILGAVLKGQDLIQNARIKKFDAKVKAWEVATWTFYDRKGRYPGDDDTDGKIGDDNVKDDFVNANFVNPPYEGSGTSASNTITIGSNTFYVYFGTDGGQDAGKNVMIICGSSDCGTAFTADQAQYIQSFDTTIDGVADGTSGQVICGRTPDGVDPNTWIAYYNTAPTTGATCDTTAKAMIYYFDAKR